MLVLAERLLQWKLVPWLQTYKAAHYLVWPSFLYGMTVQLLAALAAGALLAAAVLFPSMIGAEMPERCHPICQYIKDLVLYTVKNRAALASFAGLCLFLGLNR